MEDCMVCGRPLEYLERAELLRCAFCGIEARGHVKCPEGHFVCEACHGSDARAMIEKTALSTSYKDPIEIAWLMTAHPSLPMLGCEHAFIASGSLMAGLKNSWSRKITNADIREVFLRTSRQAQAGYCGLTGVCGIVPAVGACFSVFLGSRCGSDEEQRITMEAVARASHALMELTGPGCCKAYLWAALMVAIKMFEEKFGIVFPSAHPEIVCSHFERHPHGCRRERCPFYKPKKGETSSDAIVLPVTVCHT